MRYSIQTSCETEKYDEFLPAAWIFVFAFPIGIPLGFFSSFIEVQEMPCARTTTKCIFSSMKIRFDVIGSYTGGFIEITKPNTGCGRLLTW